MNLERIQFQYADYVSCIRESLHEKGTSAEDLRAHLLNLPAFRFNHDSKKLKLLSGRTVKFKNASTINEVFEILSLECCSFLDFGIFQSIIRHYRLDKGEEEFKYPEYVREYVKLHNIKEFVFLNPDLSQKTSDDSEILYLKFDISLTTKLSKVMDLKVAIAKILQLRASTLQLIDIKEDCVVVTYYIPANIAAAIFISDEIFTEHQIEEFRGLSVLWMKFKNYMFSFVEEANASSSEG